MTKKKYKTSQFPIQIITPAGPAGIGYIQTHGVTRRPYGDRKIPDWYIVLEHSYIDGLIKEFGEKDKVRK